MKKRFAAMAMSVVLSMGMLNGACFAAPSPSEVKGVTVETKFADGTDATALTDAATGKKAEVKVTASNPNMKSTNDYKKVPVPENHKIILNVVLTEKTKSLAEVVKAALDAVAEAVKADPAKDVPITVVRRYKTESGEIKTVASDQKLMEFLEKLIGLSAAFELYPEAKYEDETEFHMIDSLGVFNEADELEITLDINELKALYSKGLTEEQLKALEDSIRLVLWVSAENIPDSDTTAEAEVETETETEAADANGEIEVDVTKLNGMVVEIIEPTDVDVKDGKVTFACGDVVPSTAQVVYNSETVADAE